MGIKERKEREREKQRNLILGAAGEILAQEGIDNISIRKIAEKIEYSPAIIYHYFKDKEDIINNLMKKGYQKIINALSSVQILSDQPEERLRGLTRRYIDAALQMPDEFMAVQLSRSSDILEYTSSLYKGASIKKPALAILCQCLKDIYNERDIKDNTIELTAQVIAASTFGLIIRLITERVDQEQRNKLVEHYIKFIIDGVVIRNNSQF